MKQKRILYPKLLEAEMGNFTQKGLEGKWVQKGIRKGDIF